MDKNDKPVPEAIVYLKNTKTLAMKTYIAQKDGTYRFPELSNNIDYEVYAEKNGLKSNGQDAEPVRRPSQAHHQFADQYE